MVRFNVLLRDNAYDEWKRDYLNYKRLKKLLREQRALDQARTAPPVQLQRQEASARAQTAGETLPLLAAAAGAPVRLEALLEAQYAKVERAYAGHAARIGEQLALLHAQYRADAPPATLESVKFTLVELHRVLNHLLNFALINYTGFVKILRKHDLILPTRPPLLHAHTHKLQAYGFSDALACRAMLREVEHNYARLFCDGNRAMATAALMTRREAALNVAHITMGVKIGACLVLLVWVLWDTLVVPTFASIRERHVIDLALTRAYPVYRGIGCCLLLHWLLGVSMYVWRAARINYRYIFELDPRKTPHYTEIFSDATNMTIVYLINLLLYYKVVNGYFPEQVLARGYYPLALLLYTVYFYLVRPWRRQRGIVRTVFETMGSPCFPVTFFHVFVGNYLTSTVKVNQDLAWSVCFFATKEFLRPDHVPAQISQASLLAMQDADGASCRTNEYYVKLVVPLICALPLWWRFLQCLRRVHDTKTWWPNLPNAFKYALTQVVALFGLFHPFYAQSADPDSGVHGFHIVWIALFTLSSLYTWAWDVWMDWGLGRREFKFLGDRQMFSRLWVYYAAIVADLFLCFAWTLTLIPPHTFSSLPLYLQPFTMVLELFRRTFWGFFQLENEHLRNTQGFRRFDFIPLHYDRDTANLNKPEDDDDDDDPLRGHVFLIEIVVVLCLVLGLSVLAILVEK